MPTYTFNISDLILLNIELVCKCNYTESFSVTHIFLWFPVFVFKGSASVTHTPVMFNDSQLVFMFRVVVQMLMKLVFL